MAERDPQFAGQRNASKYEADYGAWVATQASLLREQRFGELDLADLIDEVESLGRSDFHRFESAIMVVLVHLLKWDIQTDHRTRSRADSIQCHREQVERLLKDSPSYKARLGEAIEQAYRRARTEAHHETMLPRRTLPEVCPYTWEEIMIRPIVWEPDEQMKRML